MYKNIHWKPKPLLKNLKHSNLSRSFFYKTLEFIYLYYARGYENTFGWWDTWRDRTNRQLQQQQLQHWHHFIQQISQHQIKKTRIFNIYSTPDPFYATHIYTLHNFVYNVSIYERNQQRTDMENVQTEKKKK